MVPVVESLKKDYKGKVRVDFIDVKAGENRDKVMKLNLNLIPTQIFYDSAGKEIFRHEGFFSKEDMEKVMKEKGLVK